MVDEQERNVESSNYAEAVPPELAAGLAELPAEQQAALGAAAARFGALSHHDQVAVRAAAERELIDHQAAQVVEAVLDALRGRTVALLPRLAEAAASCRQTGVPGSPFAELAGFIDAVAARLQGGPASNVPVVFRAHYETVLAAMTGRARAAYTAEEAWNAPGAGPVEDARPEDG